MIKVCVSSLGCPKNLVDSEKLLANLAGKKIIITDNIAKADFVIINTCSFIEQAKEESINTILRIINFRNERKSSLLIAVIGCMVEHYGQKLRQELKEVDFFLKFKDYPDLKRIITNLNRQKAKRKITLNDKKSSFSYNNAILRYPLTPPHYSYLKIAEGCSNACSFCVIPRLRGKFKSRDQESILREVKYLTKKGVKEIIITAQDSTFYGKDIYRELYLAKLLKKIAKIKGIEWIRIMYAYPKHITSELLKTIAQEDKICKYLDIPLQHINSAILKQMRRKMNKEETIELISLIRNTIPGITLRTTFIVGFPNETNQEHQELLNFIKEIKFERLGAFIYSPEEKTKAGKIKKQVPEKIKKERLNKLMLVQKEIMQEHNKKMLGKKVKVLLDKKINKKENIFIGRTQRDAPDIDLNVFLKSRQVSTGQIVKAKITGFSAYDLEGKLED